MRSLVRLIIPASVLLANQSGVDEAPAGILHTQPLKSLAAPLFLICVVAADQGEGLVVPIADVGRGSDDIGPIKPDLTDAEVQEFEQPFRGCRNWISEERRVGKMVGSTCNSRGA